MKFKNKVHIEGYIYECKVEEKVSGKTSKNPGTKYLSGDLDIATNDAILMENIEHEWKTLKSINL